MKQLLIGTMLVVVSILGTGCSNARSNDYESSSQPPRYNPPLSSNYHTDEEGPGSHEPYSGTTTVEACSSNSGNCYELDADIEDGNVEVIHFSNGGYLHLDGAELDENGDASGESYSLKDGYNGDEWEIHCDDCE